MIRCCRPHANGRLVNVFCDWTRLHFRLARLRIAMCMRVRARGNLVRGGLEIRADDHIEHMVPGDAWFEGANSPVRAAAIDGGNITVHSAPWFYRWNLKGSRPLHSLTQMISDKPKLQTNHRFFDQRITL